MSDGTKTETWTLVFRCELCGALSKRPVKRPGKTMAISELSAGRAEVNVDQYPDGRVFFASAPFDLHACEDGAYGALVVIGTRRAA